MAYLKKTNNATILGVKGTKGFPVILNKNSSVHWVSLNYFLNLAQTNAISTLGTYAGHLTDFFSQLEVDGLEISDISDAWINAYRKEVIHRTTSPIKENTVNYASQLIRSVLAYCYWLTENRIEEYLCGPSKLHKIQIVLDDKNRIRHSASKNTTQDKRPILVPRTEWINAIKAFGPERDDLSKRFELMLDWGRCAGLRAHEICCLKINQIPSRETAERALKESRNIPLTLTVTKGSKQARIFIFPLLVIETWNYIQMERTALVHQFEKKAKKRREIYKEPAEIFLSDKTGKKLSSISFSNSIRAAFKRAVENGKLTLDERVWAHGLRHNFVTWLLQSMDAEGQKNPEQLAIQSTRHSHVDSMTPYLSERFNIDFS